jgi:predicted PurR-regulated permease PerM
VATISKPPSSTQKTVQDARRLSLPVVAGGVVIGALYYGRMLFITFLVGVIIAFILEPFVALLVRLRLPRSLAAFLVCTVALLGLYVVGMGAYSQLAGIYDELPRYSQRIADVVDSVQQKLSQMEERTYQMVVPARQRQQQQQEDRARAQQAPPQPSRRRRTAEPPPPLIPPPPAIQEVRIHEDRTAITDYIYSRLNSFYEILLMVSFVPFLVYFMLSWRDHLNRSFLQFFQGEGRMVAARSLEGIAGMVRAFVVGNFLLGILLAILSSAVFWVIRLPFPLLVGPLSGLLSLVPYIGLPLALVPPLFGALAVNRFSVYVMVVVATTLLHLIAMNLFYPKVVGSRVHLNPLVVTFSLMFWGFLWDAPGLLLAIPLTAGLKAVCDNVQGLRAFGKFLGD